MKKQDTATAKNYHLHDHCCNIDCLSWTAIIAGALVAVGLSFLLNLFGVAIGLAAYTTSKAGITILAIGAFFGMAIGIMVVMFFAGWVSGYLGRAHCINRHFGALYGLTTWCLALVVSAVLVTYFGDFVNKQHNAFINANESVLKMASNAASSKSSDKVTAADTKQDTTQVQSRQSKEATANTMGKALLLTFLLFLVGAVTCCYGGYVGMKK